MDEGCPFETSTPPRPTPGTSRLSREHERPSESVHRSSGQADSPHILALGLNYRTAPIGLREQLSFQTRELDDSLSALKEHVSEGAILSTCHRVEFYVAGTDVDEAEESLEQFWSDTRRVHVDEFRPYLYRLVDYEAAEHLLEVSCGLDSAIIGESQVLGQVRDALNRGLAVKSMGAVLSTLFRQAVTTGKKARTETAIGRNAASIGSAAVEAARQRFGDLTSARVLLVGAGKMGELTAKSLLDRGASEIAVVGHTIERAQRLAMSCGSMATLTQLEDGLRTCDIVISGTSAPHYIVLKQHVERAIEARQGRPLLIVDIAIPRDVEPESADVPGVTVLNIDDLEGIVQTNLNERLSEADNVRQIIADGLLQFSEWMNVKRVVPTITALIRHADEIRDEELARSSDVLGRLSQEDRRRVEALTRAIQKKLLHPSIKALRTSAASGDGLETSRVVSSLFGLNPADDSSGLEEAS